MGVELVQKQIDYLLLIEEELYKIMGEVYQKPLEKNQNLQEVVKRVYQKRQQINDNHKKDMELLRGLPTGITTPIRSMCRCIIPSPRMTRLPLKHLITP